MLPKATKARRAVEKWVGVSLRFVQSWAPGLLFTGKAERRPQKTSGGLWGADPWNYAIASTILAVMLILLVMLRIWNGRRKQNATNAPKHKQTQTQYDHTQYSNNIPTYLHGHDYIQQTQLPSQMHTQAEEHRNVDECRCKITMNSLSIEKRTPTIRTKPPQTDRDTCKHI